MPMSNRDGTEEGVPQWERLTSDEAGGRSGTGAGRVFVRNLPPGEQRVELDGEIFFLKNEEIVDVDPDHGHQGGVSFTSDQMLGKEPFPKTRCARCELPVSGPCIAGKAFDSIICGDCARKGSANERLMISLTKRPRGRPRKG